MASLGPGSPQSFNIAPGDSLADVDLKKKMALALMMQGASSEPVQHWTQGLARLAQSAMGGYELYQAQQEDKADREKARSIIQALSGGATSPTAPPVPQPASAPIDPTVSRAPAGIAGKIVGAESGGVLSAHNPNSSAAGPGQFIDSTWLETVKRARPDLAAGKDDAAILAMRTDPKFAGLSEAMTGEYAKQNAGILASSGLPVTPGTTYLAHFVGPGGATKILSADPSTPVSALLDPAAIKANPNIANMTAGDLRAWADRKMGGPPATAPVGAPVDQPRGGLGDERRQQLIAALSSTRAGAPFAQQLFAKELDREATRARPLTEDEKKIYPGAVAIKAGGEPIFPPPSTNVQLSTVANPVLEGVGKQIVDQRKAAQVATQQTIPIIHDARKFLDEGAITGQFADPQLMLKKVGSAFGITDPKTIENTEAFRAAIGNEVLAHIKTLGANPSNTDRDYIEKIQGGQIKLDEGSLRKILDMTEKYARNTIKNFNADAGKLIGSSPEGTYKQIAPLMQFEEPPQYVAPTRPTAAPATPAGSTAPAGKVRRYNPETGKIE